MANSIRLSGSGFTFGGHSVVGPRLITVLIIVVSLVSVLITFSIEGPGHVRSAGKANGNPPVFVAEPTDPRFGQAYMDVSFTAIVKDVDGDALTLTWEWGDGTANDTTTTEPASSNTIVTNQHSYNPTPEPGRGGYEVQFTMNLTLDDGNGNTVTAQTQVVIHMPFNSPPSIVEFSASQFVVDPSDPVQLVAAANDTEGEALAWTFVFNDSVSDVHTEVYHTPATAPGEVVWNNISHIFGVAGNYTVRLNVSDALPPYQVWPHNVSQEVSIAVTPNNTPISTEVYSDPSSPVIDDMADGAEVSLMIEVFDFDGDIVTATWSFGDGSSNETNTSAGGTQVFSFTKTHTFYSPGQFNISVEVSDGRPGHAFTKYLILTVVSTNLPPLLLGFEIQSHVPQSFVGEKVEFEALVTDPELDAIEFWWDFGDGSPMAFHNVSDFVDMNVTCEENHTYTAPGTYTLVLRYTDNKVGLFVHEKWYNVSIAVVVDDILPVADAGQNSSVVGPTTVFLDGTGSSDNWGIANYTWTFTYNGSTVILWGSSPHFDFWTFGVYEIVLDITDMAGNHNTTNVTVEIVEVIPEFGTILVPVFIAVATIIAARRLRTRGSA